MFGIKNINSVKNTLNDLIGIKPFKRTLKLMTIGYLRVMEIDYNNIYVNLKKFNIESNLLFSILNLA